MKNGVHLTRSSSKGSEDCVEIMVDLSHSRSRIFQPPSCVVGKRVRAYIAAVVEEENSSLWATVSVFRHVKVHLKDVYEL